MIYVLLTKQPSWPTCTRRFLMTFHSCLCLRTRERFLSKPLASLFWNSGSTRKGDGLLWNVWKGVVDVEMLPDVPAVSASTLSTTKAFPCCAIYSRWRKLAHKNVYPKPLDQWKRIALLLSASFEAHFGLPLTHCKQIACIYTKWHIRALGKMLVIISD